MSARTSRPRLAPSADRIASSACREAPRARARLPTFTQATSRTATTPANSTSSPRLASPTIESSRRPTEARTPLLKRASDDSSRAEITAASARAISSVACLLRRATISYLRTPGNFASPATLRRGIHSPAVGDGNAKPRGMTPTIVYGRPSSRNDRPTGSDAPNRRRHNSRDSTATGASLSRTSSTRPAIGRVPSVSKKLSETRQASARSGSP